MKRILGLFIVIILIFVFAGRTFATDVVTENTNVETGLEDELSDVVESPSENIEEPESNEDELVTIDPTVLDNLKNTLNTVLAQSNSIKTVYYIVGITSTVIGIVVLIFFGRGNRKHNKEITQVVCDQVGTLYTKQVGDSIAVLEDCIKPVMEEVSKTQEAVVKAIVLLQHKDKTSSLEALDCLKEVLNSDAQSKINEIKESLKARLSTQEERRQNLEKELSTLVERAEKEITDGKTFIQDLSKKIF